MHGEVLYFEEEIICDIGMKGTDSQMYPTSVR